jgi:hypothetical protein
VVYAQTLGEGLGAQESARAGAAAAEVRALAAEIEALLEG